MRVQAEDVSYRSNFFSLNLSLVNLVSRKPGKSILCVTLLIEIYILYLKKESTTGMIKPHIYNDIMTLSVFEKIVFKL